jgi:hypothetical protein
VPLAHVEHDAERAIGERDTRRDVVGSIPPAGSRSSAVASTADGPPPPASARSRRSARPRRRGAHRLPRDRATSGPAEARRRSPGTRSFSARGSDRR